MQVNFRQGLVSHQALPFLQVNGNVIDLLADNKSVTVTLAHRDTNYTHSEDNTVLTAWTGPFDVGTSYYLYWEFNALTFVPTFAKTTYVPIAQNSDPGVGNVDEGQSWFDTANNIHYKLAGGAWVETLRVYAAQLFNGTFISLSLPGNFTGTQIGNNNAAASGRVLLAEDAGNPMQRSDGTFFTTEDQFFTNQSRMEALRLESNVSRAQSTTSLSAYEIVVWSDFGKISSANYNDTGSAVVGVLTEDLIADQVGAVIVQGTITNPTASPIWSWTTVGASLWIENGLLTETDPNLSNPGTYPTKQVPVARVLSADTIIFEQGLGGVGAQGPAGISSTPPFSDVAVFGITSITPTPAVSDTPVAVGENHPVIIGGPYATSTHTHAATDVFVTPVGNISNNVLQLVLAELDTEKVKVSGDIMTGILTLSTDPTNPLDAATKGYVDTELQAKVLAATYEKIDVGASPTDVINTIVPTIAAAGSPLLLATLQVFRNGMLQSEGDGIVGSPATDDFIVSGANQITFASGTILANDLIIIYAYSV